MYSAQHPLQGTNFQEFTGAPMPEDIHGLNEAQMDRELMQRGIGFVYWPSQAAMRCCR